MRGVITRFLNLQVMNFHPAVYWGLLIIWVILLVAAFSSLREIEMSLGAKIAWFLVILFVPIIGLALYAVRCLIRSDWTFLKPLLQSRSQAVKAVIDPGKRPTIK